MAWNTIGASDAASMDHFMLTFKFLALKEIKIREEMEASTTSNVAKEATRDNEPDPTSVTTPSDISGVLHVNLDMQNRMLANAIEAGLQKVRSLTTTTERSHGENLSESGTSSASKAASPSSQGESSTDILETLHKICEKRRRVLAELAAVSGVPSSKSLLRCQLMAVIYHFEVCAKSRRHAQMAALLNEIVSLTSAGDPRSIPPHTVFESLVDFCLEAPADPRLNHLVVSECLVYAMKARAGVVGSKSSASPAVRKPQSSSPTPLLTLPKVFEEALDFVSGVVFPPGESVALADRICACFAQFLASASSWALKESEASTSLVTLAVKSFDLGLRCRRGVEEEAAKKWFQLSLDLAKRGGAKELQSKSLAQLENKTMAGATTKKRS